MKSNNEMYQECIELLDKKKAERNDTVSVLRKDTLSNGGSYSWLRGGRQSWICCRL